MYFEWPFLGNELKLRDQSQTKLEAVAKFPTVTMKAGFFVFFLKAYPNLELLSLKINPA